MRTNQYSIVFVDNVVNRVFKTLESLKKSYKDLHVFNQESEFLEYISTSSPDLILLNLDLQPNDAIVLSKEIRQRQLQTEPFIVIYSDKQDDFVQELAFNSGVDSFINFHYKASVMELFIKNILKRRPVPVAVNKKEIIIDTDRHLIFKKGAAFQLPRKEFKLFELLYNNAEKFFSKTEIASMIWNNEAIANKRTIDVHIYNIRQFFGKRIIRSQKGKGYRINKKIIG